MIRVITTVHVGESFVNPCRANPSDYGISTTNRSKFLGKPTGGIVECMMVGEVAPDGSNIGTPKSITIKGEQKEYKCIRVMPLPVEYERFAAFLGEALRFKSAIMPYWRGGLEFKTTMALKNASGTSFRLGMHRRASPSLFCLSQ